MASHSSTYFHELLPSVVASISTAKAWNIATSLTSDHVNFLEIRADLLLEQEKTLPGNIADLALPVILTVRCPSEGGKASSLIADREVVYQNYLSQVAAIDLELASASQLTGLIATAKNQGVGVILSHHNFQTTPDSTHLQQLTSQAVSLRADLLKVATVTDDFAQLNTLAQWVDSEKNLPLAAMGMGRLGKISRPLLAQLGSRLNYGFLDAPLVPGQWPASELRRLIDSLSE